jgi:hypothetical protein
MAKVRRKKRKRQIESVQERFWTDYMEDYARWVHHDITSFLWI